MKSIPGEFSLVVIGAWNPSIFNETWINTHLLDNAEDFQIAYPIEDVTAPRRISFSGINLFPGRKKLEVSPEDASLEKIQACQSLVVKIFELLSHTPIIEMGVNFGFECEHNGKLAELFSLQDNPDILEEFAIKGTTIRRTLTKEGEAGVLNLSIDNYQGNYQLRINFHYTNMNSQICKELLEANVVTSNYDNSLQLLDKLYGLQLSDDQ